MSLLRQHQLLMSSPQSESGSWNPTVAALPGLWGWWKLDELAGAGTAADSSGNGRDGTYTGTGVRTTPGIFSGSAAYRSSLGGRINLPDFPISDSPQFSIVAWILPDGAFSIKSIVSGDGDPRAFQFRLTAQNRPEYITFTAGSGATNHNLTQGDSMTGGVPAMIAVTHDRVGPIKKALYINGAQVATATEGAIHPDRSPAPIAIGARNSGAEQEPWGGGMDEVIITTTSLSASQISALWDARNS